MNNITFADTSNVHELYQRADLIIDLSGKIDESINFFVQRYVFAIDDIGIILENIKSVVFLGFKDKNSISEHDGWAFCLILELEVEKEKRIYRLWADGQFMYDKDINGYMECRYYFKKF